MTSQTPDLDTSTDWTKPKKELNRVTAGTVRTFIAIASIDVSYGNFSVGEIHKKALTLLTEWKKKNPFTPNGPQRASKSDIRIPTEYEILEHLRFLERRKIVEQKWNRWAPTSEGRALFRALNANDVFPIFCNGFDDETSPNNWKIEFLIRILRVWPDMSVYDLDAKNILLMNIKTAQNVLAAHPDKFIRRRGNVNTRKGKTRAGATDFWTTLVKITPKDDPEAANLATLHIPPQTIKTVGQDTPVASVPANNTPLTKTKGKNTPVKDELAWFAPTHNMKEVPSQPGTNLFVEEPKFVGEFLARTDLSILLGPKSKDVSETPTPLSVLQSLSLQIPPSTAATLAEMARETGDSITVLAEILLVKAVTKAKESFQAKKEDLENARKKALRSALIE